MAKRKKPRAPKGANPPLNMPPSGSIEEMHVLESGCMMVSPERDDWGVLTILTPVGYYTFMVTVETANDMIQALREFIAGASAPVVDD